jgi:uncharacterized membrane protein
MDLGIIVAIIMLIMWAIGALVMQGPGWIHLLLTAGVSLLIYRIVVRTSKPAKSPPTR